MNSAVNAAALQDHLMKQLKLKKSKAPSLAQKLGLVQGLPAKLTDDEWLQVKDACKDPAGNCPICLERFRDRPQVILTCAHVFHRDCFASFRRATDIYKCPVCRLDVSDFASFDGGLKAFKQECATKLQAFFRGARARAQQIFSKDSLLARARIVRKLRAIGSRVEAQSRRRLDFVAAFLAAVDQQTSRNLKEIRIGLRTLAEMQTGENASPSVFNFVPTDSKWCDPLRACLDRNDQECAICFEAFKGTSVSLLSCSHVFHETCIVNVEDFVKHERTHHLRCPVCRQTDYERIALNQLIN